MAVSSFRDPAGFVVRTDSQVFRVIEGAEAVALLDFLNSARGRSLVEGGSLIASHEPSQADRDQVLSQVADRVDSWSGTEVLEHERIWFPSYPYEWPRAMLREAALVTLRLSEQLLEDGYGLKDATPYNVLFRGPEAVFIDALSIEKRDPADPIWRPLAQFLQTFLYPLWAETHGRISLQETLLARREGLTPDDLYLRLGWSSRLQPSLLRWLSIPKWLDGRGKGGSPSYASRKLAPEAARRMLRTTFGGLRKAVEAIPELPGERSTWSHYSLQCHYSAGSRDAKHEFVEQALRELRPGRVLDLGANDGEYSLLAASAGHEVVSCDIDATAVGRLWRKAKETGAAILPMVANVANPSPAMGWDCEERSSLLSRAEGQFDCLMMLALLHHLTVTERVPLDRVLGLAARLTRNRAVIEWVGPNDPYYHELLRGRDALHSADTPERFEEACGRHFRVIRKAPVMEGRRWLFLLSKH